VGVRARRGRTMSKRWIAGVVAATWFVAACGGSGGKGADPTTTTKPKAAETTTTVDTSKQVGEDFQALAEDANDAIQEEATARDDFAAENDLDGAIESTRDLRNDLFDFDKGVRDLEFPDDHASAVNEVLSATGSYIDLLDGFLEIEDIPAYNDQLDKEADVRDAWTEAVNALADDLGTDGISSSVGDDDDTTTTEPDTEDEVQAGDTISDGTLSIEVPEGFTATAGATIQMEHESGAMLGIYTTFPESATTLEDVAKDSAEGAADKNDWEIVGGPEDLEVGDFDAIGYSLKDDDGMIHISIYFDTEVEGQSRWRDISVDVSEDDVDTVMSAVEAVAPTVKLED
jgi:hypothetical protein